MLRALGTQPGGLQRIVPARSGCPGALLDVCRYSKGSRTELPTCTLPLRYCPTPFAKRHFPWQLYFSDTTGGCPGSGWWEDTRFGSTSTSNRQGPPTPKRWTRVSHRGFSEVCLEQTSGRHGAEEVVLDPLGLSLPLPSPPPPPSLVNHVVPGSIWWHGALMNPFPQV